MHTAPRHPGTQAPRLRIIEINTWIILLETSSSQEKIVVQTDPICHNLDLINILVEQRKSSN